MTGAACTAGRKWDAGVARWPIRKIRAEKLCRFPGARFLGALAVALVVGVGCQGNGDGPDLPVTVERPTPTATPPDTSGTTATPAAPTRTVSPAPPATQEPTPTMTPLPPTATTIPPAQTVAPTGTAEITATPAGTATPTTASSPVPSAPAATQGAGSPAFGEVTLSPAFPGLGDGAFPGRTVLAKPVPGSDGRTVVVLQEGLIVSVENGAEPTTRAVLDISERVSEDGREEGLLGLAFDPSYDETGELYLYYSAASPRRSVLSRFTAGSDGSINPDSEDVLLEISQPYSNHNGGMIEFGPDDYLYVGVGDGGSGGDPHGNGQNTQTLLGNILRIDPSTSVESQPYAIPPDNPFADGESGRAEIWAYGLRNPWRFSFGPEGRLWAGDVGQNAWEEIDIVERGGNYGWNIMEGNHCFRPSEDCNREGLTPPIIEYSHNLGCSVTGGYVYRGSDIEWLRGAYVFADFCSGRVWAMTHSEGQAKDVALLADADRNIASFGEDHDGEMFVLAGSGVFRLQESDAGDDAG